MHFEIVAVLVLRLSFAGRQIVLVPEVVLGVVGVLVVVVIVVVVVVVVVVV
jgi:hypothetical protein